MITFQIEKLDQFLESAFPLFDNHYQEVVEKTDVIKLNPNLDIYYILEKKNILEIHTARDDEKLIGYSMWIVNQHINFKDSLTANSDSLYVSPEYRKGMFGAKFIKWTFEKIKERNPQRVMFHVKDSVDYSPILKRLGSKHCESTYTMVLE